MFDKLGSLVGKKDQQQQEETSDAIAKIWTEWKATHPGMTIRDFWAAVGKGEVDIPSK
jgi:hypothetical protein